MSQDDSSPFEGAVWLTEYDLVINDQLAAARPAVPDVPADQINVADKPATDWSASGIADANLTESLKKNGVTRPVIVWRQTREIIDGIRLYRVARELGLPYAVVYIACADLNEAMAERVRYNLGTCVFPSHFARAWVFLENCQGIIARWRDEGRKNQVDSQALCPAPDKASESEEPNHKVDWLQMAADAVNVTRSEVYYANCVRQVKRGERPTTYPPQKLEHDLVRAFRGEIGGYTLWTNIRCHNDRTAKDEKFNEREKLGNERQSDGSTDGDEGDRSNPSPAPVFDAAGDNQVVLGNMFDVLPTLPNGLINTFLFSPPYYLPANKQRARDIAKTFYDLEGDAAEWLESWPAYQKGTRQYCEHIDRHLRSENRGGYVVVNVSNTRDDEGLWYYHTDLLRDIAGDLQWFDLGEWIWAKMDISGRKFGWGSEDNPIARINHEYVLVLRVGEPKRGPSTLFHKELQKFTMTDWGEVEATNIPDEWRIPERWEIAPVSHPLHPAIFPKKLVYRCLQLWSGHGDVVCDPFCGVGTTGYVAALLGRRFVGIELGQTVADIAAEQVAAATELYETNRDAASREVEKWDRPKNNDSGKRPPEV